MVIVEDPTLKIRAYKSRFLYSYTPNIQRRPVPPGGASLYFLVCLPEHGSAMDVVDATHVLSSALDCCNPGSTILCERAHGDFNGSHPFMVRYQAQPTEHVPSDAPGAVRCDRRSLGIFSDSADSGMPISTLAETVEASALAWVAKDMVVPVRPARGRCRQYLPGRHALGMRPCSFGSESSRRRRFTDGSGFGPSADHSVANAARSPSHCSSALTRTVTMHARKDMLVINCVKRTSQP